MCTFNLILQPVIGEPEFHKFSVTFQKGIKNLIHYKNDVSPISLVGGSELLP